MIAVGFPVILALAVLFFVAARQRALGIAAGGGAGLHSRPNQHGLYALLLTLIIGWGILGGGAIIWAAIDKEIVFSAIRDAAPDLKQIEVQLVFADARSLADGTLASATDPLRREIAALYAHLESWRSWTLFLVSIAAAVAAGLYAWRRVSPEWRARNRSEQILTGILWVCAAVAVLTTVGIVLSLIFETLTFFGNIGWRIDKFLFGTNWSPLAGVQAGVMDPNRVGAVPLFVGTFLITLIAMLVAVPVGLFSAIYLSDFASPRVRSWAKPMLEILAGIPTVVYGFFAAITVAPFIRDSGTFLGLDVASESALAAGVVMGIMIIPFISSLSDDVINAVPQSLRDGSYGLGATKAETIRQVVLPAALPGIVSAVLLGVSRAVGETMIVVMAAGQGANLTLNPLETVTTVTVQIVMLITGDTDAETAAGPAFSLGFALFFITLILNVIALKVVRRYREMYD